MRRPLFAALLGLLAAQTPAPAQRFGEDRAMNDTLACIESAALDLLAP